MNFIPRFLIVSLWMMAMTALSLGVAKNCIKKQKTTPFHIVKKSQDTNHTSSTSNKTAAVCGGNISLRVVPFEETATSKSYSNKIFYLGFIAREPAPGFYKLLFSPPRRLLNI